MLNAIKKGCNNLVTFFETQSIISMDLSPNYKSNTIAFE